MSIAIKIENISKKYVINHKPEKYSSNLREEVMNSIKKFGKRLNPFSIKSESTSKYEELWALKDVSFEIKQGERVGIIGRNGAGKSTFLKLLSRITVPTIGRISIRGKVASLLEVGTGFHPELTGRENIYLNGAILGMSKVDIRKKFDEIIVFAEIEKFIDTPVKRYSSGMYVRLAFAVAAHVEPDILLVDEVLSVGDIDFQRKCLGKMQDVTGEGRTVLFVSHNTGSIVELCKRTVLLNNGKLVGDGETKTIVSKYLSGLQKSEGEFDLTNPSLRFRMLQNSSFKWTRAVVLNSIGKQTTEIKFKEPFEVVLQGIALRPVQNTEICFAVYSDFGVALFNSCQRDSRLSDDYSVGQISFRIKFDPNLFGPGQYSLDIFATAPNVLDYIRSAAKFSVSSVNEVSGDCVRQNYGGVIIYPCIWSVDK